MKTNISDSKSRYQKISEPTPYPSEARNSLYTTDKKNSIQSISEMVEPICILADKVYSYCQQRDCFPSFRINIQHPAEQLQFITISFQEGYVSEGTLKIMPIGPKRPNFSRIKFTLKIPYTIQLRNKVSNEFVTLNGLLPELLKDVVLFMPESRNEFNFRIVVETRTETLAPSHIAENFIEIPIGIFSVIRVVGRTEILIPAYCFAYEPPEGENFQDCEETICQEFKKRPFPDDFFPSKFQDLDI